MTGAARRMLRAALSGPVGLDTPWCVVQAAAELDWDDARKALEAMRRNA